MKISRSSLVLTAAFTGLLSGTVARAATANGGASTLSSIAGQAANDKVEKHACKGLNSCKGRGGCIIERQRLQGQELLQGQGRLRHRRFQKVTTCNSGARRDRAPFLPINPCPPIDSTDTPITGLGSACAFRTISTSWNASRRWTGSKSFRKIT